MLKMKYNPQIHHRQSIRLKGFDYSVNATYFITICTQNRENLFGEIINDEMKMNNAGIMIEKWYLELQNNYPDIKCGECMIMPNHFHCILQNTGANNVGADLCVCPSNNEHNAIQGGCNAIQGEHIGSPLQGIIQWFKTMTTNEYIKMVKQNFLPPFNKRIWQRNYYEHIIRNETELSQIIEYIINNPFNWDIDEYK
jgi:putative transposase